MKTAGKIGKRTQVISVHSNDPDQKVVRLKISMDIQVILAVEPKRLGFGRLKKGSQYPVKYASLVGLEKDNTNIKSVKSENKHIKVEAGLFDSGDSNKKQFKVTILPEMGIGHFSTLLTIETDHKSKKNLKLFVIGEILGNIRLSSKGFSFGLLRKGVKREKIITLTAAISDYAFKVLDVQNTVPGLCTEVTTMQEGSSYLVKASISINEDFSKDALDGKVIITTDDEDQKIIEIPVWGRIFKDNLKQKNRGGSDNGVVKKR